MAADDLVLVLVERARLVEDGVRNADLPDVMEAGGELELHERRPLEVDQLAHREREPDHVLGVARGAPVAHVHRRRERRHVRAHQLRRLLATLDVLERRGRQLPEFRQEDQVLRAEAPGA